MLTLPKSAFSAFSTPMYRNGHVPIWSYPIQPAVRTEHVSEAWAADFPLIAQAYFCDTRSLLRSVASRSPLRSRSPDFLLPRSAYMLFLRKVSRATDSIPIIIRKLTSVGLPGVRFLTGQSGFLAICPVKNMMLNRTISCPVFSRPWTKSYQIVKIVATRWQIFTLKCTKFDFGWGSAPDPAGGAYSAPPDHLAGFKGAYL